MDVGRILLFAVVDLRDARAAPEQKLKTLRLQAAELLSKSYVGIQHVMRARCGRTAKVKCMAR